MTRLVAVHLADRHAAVEAVEGAWSSGEAVLVVDPAAPATAVAELLALVRPHAVVHDAAGTITVDERPDGVALPAGTATVVPTSGSTGTPRPVVLSDEAMEASARASVARLGCADGDRWLLALPLHHVAGLAVLRRCHALGSAPEVHAGFDLDAVAASESRWWPLVPTMLARLLDPGVDVAGRGVLLGGAAADPDLVDRARSAGATVAVGYGMTETCGGCVYDGVPLDGVEAAVGDDGRIRLRGAVTATGVREPDGTVAPVVDADGWLRTDDVGRLVDGRLSVDGRADHVVVTGGENVAPETVEGVLRTHDQVLDAGVLGVPDPDWGQRVVALVVPTDPDDPPTLAALRDHVGATLGRIAAPRDLHLVDALPHTSLGKLARGRLADLVVDSAG